MRIYLAGKMDREHGAWRDAILPSRYDAVLKDQAPGWVLISDADNPAWGGRDYRCSMPWPVQPNRHVLNLHEYVGPYRTDLAGSWEWKHYGEFHGSKVIGQHGSSNGEEDGLIVQECSKAISRADLLFAYINRPDCFGTLVEIGMAKASGVFTVVAVEDDAEWDWSDYWFTVAAADAVIHPPAAVEIGPEPPMAPGIRWHTADDADWLGWSERKAAERTRVQGMLRDAIVLWTARPERPVQALSVVPAPATHAAFQEVARSFSQIARWSSDPRVRNEAERMLKRIAG
jgi:hypothetical protein